MTYALLSSLQGRDWVICLCLRKVMSAPQRFILGNNNRINGRRESYRKLNCISSRLLPAR